MINAKRTTAGFLAGCLICAVTPGASEVSRVSDLSVLSDGQGRYRLTLKFSGMPASSCRLREEDGLEALILELSPAESSLKPKYDFAETPVGPVTVSSLSATGGAKGIRVEIPLRGASVKGWGITGEGMEVLFTAKPRTPAPGSAYQMGVGDRLDISVFGQDDLKATLEVLADGTVSFPLIGVMPVAGRTLAEVRAAVETRMKEFLVDPQVSLDIKDYQSQPVNVVGEVEKPGTYYLKGPTTLMDIMAQAGWMTKDAGSEIIITRHEAGSGTDGGTRQIPISKDDLLQGGTQYNPRLQSGDVITVGATQYFYIRGEVVKPGQYKLEDRPTLMKAVSIAEGLTPYARKKGIEIIRTVSGSQTKLVFDLKSIEERKASDVPLLPGDVIIVPRRLF